MKIIQTFIILFTWCAYSARFWPCRRTIPQIRTMNIIDMAGNLIPIEILEGTTTAGDVLSKISDQLGIAIWNLSLCNELIQLQDSDVIDYREQICLIKSTIYPQSAEICTPGWGRIVWNLSPDGKLSVQKDEWKGPIEISAMPCLDGMKFKGIFATGYAFAALKEDHSVLTWGEIGRGGNIDYIRVFTNILSIKDIVATRTSFMALMCDSRMISWGMTMGHDSTFSKVSKIFSTGIGATSAFAMLTEDKSVITWVDNEIDAEIPERVRTELKAGVKDVWVEEERFVAVMENGERLTWPEN